MKPFAKELFGIMRSLSRDGVTLVEMMIALVILSVIAVGLLHGITTSIRLNYAATQRAAAFSLCMDLYEKMRGANYYDVVPTNFPTETLRLTHLGGSQRVPLYCQRTCQIIEQSNPTRKEIRITVQWVYMGRTLRETLDGMIFAK
jgi:prepilin-type N-terminal cleavage/methylation domain-containing protein